MFTGHPAMFGIMFTEQAPNEYRDWANSDHDLYDAVAMGMHARGAMPEPDSREPWFICEAHAREDIVDRVVTIFADSLDAALEARATGTAIAQGPGMGTGEHVLRRPRKRRPGCRPRRVVGPTASLPSAQCPISAKPPWSTLADVVRDYAVPIAPRRRRRVRPAPRVARCSSTASSRR